MLDFLTVSASIAEWENAILEIVKQKGLAPILIVLLIAAALGGYLIYQKQFKTPPKIVQNIQSTPTPVSSPLDTSNWKTYTNKKYNLSFSYPNTWLIGERKSNASESLNLFLRPDLLSVGDPEYGVISLIVKNSELDLEEFINTLCGTISDSCDNSKKTSDIRFNNLIAKKISPIGGALPIEVIAFKKGDIIFQLNLILDSSAKPDQENLAIRHQILSTFKFD